MAGLSGIPLAYVGLTVALWAGARVALFAGDEPLVLDPAAVAAVPQSATQPSPTPLIFGRGNRRPARAASDRLNSPTNNSLHPAIDPWQNGGRPSGSYAPFRVAQDDEPLSTGRDTPPTNALALTGKAGSHPHKRRWGGEFYAYAFWRIDEGGATGLAPGAQYGGSQMGLIATVDPFGKPDSGPSLLMRLAATPDGDEREMALGLRWRPDAGWPITLSAERRFRSDAPDSFALYLAGGVDNEPMVAGWTLDAFGQVGYDTSQLGGTFFDGQARATNRIGKLPLAAGVGIWAGGQRGASRLDVGPTMVATVETGKMPILVQLDWRLRAAGNANPKDGLALTVSTGF